MTSHLDGNVLAGPATKPLEPRRGQLPLEQPPPVPLAPNFLKRSPLPALPAGVKPDVPSVGS